MSQLITMGLGESTINIPLISNIASTSYSPEFNEHISISATVTNSPSNVVVKINDKYAYLYNSSGTTYSTGMILAGSFGLCTNQTITILSTNTYGGSQEDAAQTITISASSDANYFRKARNIELSTVYYLESMIDSNWSNVNVVKSFSQVDKQSLPVVCIRLLDRFSNRRELGDTELVSDFGIIVDIFATSDGQRLDLADFILNQIKSSWVYYEWGHASGTNSSMDRVENGKIHNLRITQDRRVDFNDVQVERQDRFRHIISFTVRKFL